MESRLWTALPALLAGVIIGAVLMQAAGPSITGTSVPSHTLTTATGCQQADDPRGWVGVVPEGDHTTIYLANYSHVHDAADVAIRGELTEPAPDRWRFVITVTPVDDGRDAPADCQPRSLLDAAIAVPTAAESLTVVVAGDPIATVDTTARSPRFAYLEG